MKRILALLLAALMMCSTACTEEAPEKPALTAEEESALTGRVLSDWFDWLQINDFWYGNILWAVSHAEEFCENPTWENLQKARAAVAAAENYIAARTLPEAQMTAEDYADLLDMGRDVASVKFERERYEAERSENLQFCSNLKEALYSDVLWQQTFEDTCEYLTLKKENCIEQLQYLNYTTQYLLLTLDDEVWTEKLNAFVAEHCAALTEYAVEQLKDADAVYKAAAEVLDSLEEQTKAVNDHIGRYSASVYIMQEALEARNWRALQQNAVEISGMEQTLCLPIFTWTITEQSRFNYSYIGEDGKNVYVAPRTALSGSPDGCLWQFPDAGREDLKNYCALLEKYTLEPKQVLDTEDEYSLLYQWGDMILRFTWTEADGLLLLQSGDVAFFPEWYLLR